MVTTGGGDLGRVPRIGHAPQIAQVHLVESLLATPRQQPPT